MKNENYIMNYGRTTTTKQEIINELPPGWSDLVSKLIDDMIAAGWDGRITQVKEKFGTLHFYIGEANDKVHDLIDEAEEQSSKICIVCGEPADGHTKGWFTYRCKKHMETNL